MSIKNAEDYWDLVNSRWDDVLEIIGDRLDLLFPAYHEPGDEASSLTGRTILQELEVLKEVKDPKIARYFHAAWGLASNSYAYSRVGWGTLCDLCSEDWALKEDL